MRGGDETRVGGFLPAILVSTSALKLSLAWLLPGFLTGDDVEVVETAARCASGLDYTPSAIRSLVHPLLLACPVVRLGLLAGLGGPRWITLLASLPTVAFSTAAIALLHRLARALGLTPSGARVATLLYALHWLPLGYGSTPFPRPISSCLLLASFLLLAETGERPGAGALAAGMLAAAATAVRWSEAVALLPLLAFAALRTRGVRRPVLVLAGFVVAALGLWGLFDLWTWGRPFASLHAFVDLTRDPNLGGFHPRPFLWYLTMVLQWAGPVLLALAACGWADPRSRLPLGIALAFVALLSFSPIKQFRYLQFAVPFLALAAAVGWERLRAERAWKWVASAALLLYVPLELERTFHLLGGKSEAALAAVRDIARSTPPVRRVALEQAWAYGDRLYLGNGVEIRDLPPTRPLDRARVREAAENADAVALYAADLDSTVEQTLAEGGFRRCTAYERLRSPPVLLYRPVTLPCPAGGSDRD